MCPAPKALGRIGVAEGNAVHPSDGTTLDRENIRHQVITFLIAGHETTCGTLAFALYHLAKHPVALRLVQREVDELWGDTPDPEPTFEDVGRLRLTRQVLNETLRLWPAAPGFGRQACQDTVLGGRIALRAGQGVRIITPMLHRDPAWGDNPEAFDPFRFSPEAKAARSPHAFKPLRHLPRRRRPARRRRRRTRLRHRHRPARRVRRGPAHRPARGDRRRLLQRSADRRRRRVRRLA
ncbi:hypothetical protein B1C81_35160 [Streptomyces sp. HG99]|nr:hypothetical protein B1C81_35160 [Streptomyces sp. HG99]